MDWLVIHPELKVYQEMNPTFPERNLAAICATLMMVFIISSILAAQNTSLPEKTKGRQQPSAEKRVNQNYLRAILIDERRLWSSPMKLSRKNATWLIPMAGITAGLLASDLTLSQTTSSPRKSHISDAGV